MQPWIPEIGAVIQDRADLKRAQTKVLLSLEEEGTNLAFQVHDFVRPQTARPRGFGNCTKSDVYLLCQTLHNWDDEQPTFILRYLAAALGVAGPASRMIVIIDEYGPATAW